VNGILPANHTIEDGERLIFSQKAYSAALKKQMHLSKENHQCWKQEHVALCFHVRIDLVFERNTSSKS
jgi:hypothetical protein